MVPDILLLGKAMGNGYPVSAMIARPEVCARVRPEQFSSSHSGNPGGCAAALAVLDAFAGDDVLGAGARLAELFARRLGDIAARQRRVGRVRQRGLAIGVRCATMPGVPAPGVDARNTPVTRGGWWPRCASRGIVMNSPIGRRATCCASRRR